MSRKLDRLSERQLASIRKLRSSGLSTSDIAERFGFTKQWIEKVLARDSDRGGSCGKGLGPRSSQAVSDRSPAR